MQGSSTLVAVITNLSYPLKGIPTGLVFCGLGMQDDMQSKSLFINGLNMSVILSANCFLLNVQVKEIHFRQIQNSNVVYCFSISGMDHSWNNYSGRCNLLSNPS